MFEKEASEKANKKYPIPKVCNELDVARNRKYEEGFKDGAAFGYNKAIVEIKDAYEGNGNFSAWFESYLEGKNV